MNFLREDLVGKPDVVTLPLYSRGLCVTPDDSFILATYGTTFWWTTDTGWNLVSIDLEKRTNHPLLYTDTIRRFSSECPSPMYVGPWHGSHLVEYDKASDSVTEYRLPEPAYGWPVDEFNYVHHDCERHRV